MIEVMFMCFGGGGSAPVVTPPPTVTDVSNVDAGVRNDRNTLRRRQLHALSKQNTAANGQMQGALVDGVRKTQLGA